MFENHVEAMDMNFVVSTFKISILYVKNFLLFFEGRTQQKLTAVINLFLPPVSLLHLQAKLSGNTQVDKGVMFSVLEVKI